MAIVAFGWMIGHRSDGARRPQPVPASSRVESPVTPVAARVTTDTARKSHQDDDIGMQTARAQRDPAYTRELMARYAAEVDLDSRGALLAILQGAPNAEVRRFALQLADSRDPTQRREGLELLRSFSLDETDVRTLLLRQTTDETDPETLRTLVDMLVPAVVPSEDAAPIVERLAQLLAHPDPEVRAASVLQTSGWDKGDDLEGILHQAMLDPDTRVRQAAMAGITSSRVRSDRLKDVLLERAYDPGTALPERSAAIFALQEFPLDRAEYALYRQAAEQTRVVHPVGEAGGETDPGERPR